MPLIHFDSEAQKTRDEERVIRSFFPGLYLPLWKRDGAQFLSDDAFATLWVATGTLKTQQGRVMDGDDYLKYTVANWRSSDQVGAISAWFKTTSATYQSLFASADEAGTTNFLTFQLTNLGKMSINVRNAGGNDSVDGDGIYKNGAFHFATVTSDGSAWKIFVDNREETLTVTVGANNGNWLADVPDRDNVTTGALAYNSTTANHLTGTDGAVFYVPRTFTLSDHMRLKESTYWRYR